MAQDWKDSKVIRAGWLRKSGPARGDNDKGGGRRMWSLAAHSLRRKVMRHGNYQKRFFVLNDSSLKYYKDAARKGEAKGVIPLNTILSVTPCTRADAPAHSFDMVTDVRSFTLAAETAVSASAWCGLLNQRMKSVGPRIRTAPRKMVSKKSKEGVMSLEARQLDPNASGDTTAAKVGRVLNTLNSVISRFRSDTATSTDSNPRPTRRRPSMIFTAPPVTELAEPREPINRWALVTGNGPRSRLSIFSNQRLQHLPMFSPMLDYVHRHPPWVHVEARDAPSSVPSTFGMPTWAPGSASMAMRQAECQIPDMAWAETISEGVDPSPAASSVVGVERDLEHVLRHLVLLNVPAGHVFCRPGAPPTSMFMILHGTVRVAAKGVEDDWVQPVLATRARSSSASRRRRSVDLAAASAAGSASSSAGTGAGAGAGAGGGVSVDEGLPGAPVKGDWVDINAVASPTLLGLHAFVHQIPYEVTMRALTGCHVAVLSLEAYHYLQRVHPQSAVGLSALGSLSDPLGLLTSIPCLAAALSNNMDRAPKPKRLSAESRPLRSKSDSTMVSNHSQELRRHSLASTTFDDVASLTAAAPSAGGGTTAGATGEAPKLARVSEAGDDAGGAQRSEAAEAVAGDGSEAEAGRSSEEATPDDAAATGGEAAGDAAEAAPTSASAPTTGVAAGGGITSVTTPEPVEEGSLDTVSAGVAESAGARSPTDADADAGADDADTPSVREPWRHKPLHTLLAALFRCVQLEPGHVLFNEGDMGSCCYVVAQGTVSISARDFRGRDLELRVLGRGRCIGEGSLVQPGPRRVKAVALTRVILFRLTHASLLRALSHRPVLWRTICLAVERRSVKSLMAVDLIQLLTKGASEPERLVGMLGDLFDCHLVSTLASVRRSAASSDHDDSATAAAARPPARSFASFGSFSSMGSFSGSPTRHESFGGEPGAGGADDSSDAGIVGNIAAMAADAARAVAEAAEGDRPASAEAGAGAGAAAGGGARPSAVETRPPRSPTHSLGAVGGRTPSRRMSDVSAISRELGPVAVRRSEDLVAMAGLDTDPYGVVTVQRLQDADLEALLLVASGCVKIVRPDGSTDRDVQRFPGEFIGGKTVLTAHHHASLKALVPGMGTARCVVFSLDAARIEAWASLFAAGQRLLGLRKLQKKFTTVEY